MGRWIAIAAALAVVAAGGLLVFLPGRGNAPAPAGRGSPGVPIASAPSETIAPAGGAAPAPSVAGEGVTSGILLRSRTRTPVAGTVVVTTRTGRACTSAAGADGVFRVGGLIPGELLGIEFRSPGLLPLRVGALRIPPEGELHWPYVLLGEGQELSVVVTGERGEPVPGCSLEVFPPVRESYGRSGDEDPEPEASAGTDESGKAQFPALPVGEWLVRATAAGYSHRSLSVDLVEGARRGPLRMRLVAGHTLEGRVLDAGGAVAAGISIAAVSMDDHRWGGRGRHRVLTDAEGRFRCEGLPAGNAEITVFAVEGIREAYRTVEVPSPGPLEIRLLPRGDAHGRVVEDGSGSPLAGALVSAVVPLGDESESGYATAHTTSGPDGTFRFPGLPVHPRANYEAELAGYMVRPQEETDAPEEDPPATVPGAEVVIRLLRGAGVRGVVRDSAGAPVPLAWVVLQMGGRHRWGGSVIADGEGRFRFPCVPSGIAVLEAGGRNRHMAQISQETYQKLMEGQVPEGSGFEVPETGEVVRDIVLVPDSRVEGRMVFADGRPASGFVPRVLRSNSSTSELVGAPSAEDGSFAVEDLGPMKGCLVAAEGPAGELGRSAEFDIPESDVVRGVAVTVAAPGSLSGIVRRKDGGPVDRGTVRLVDRRFDPEQPWDWGTEERSGVLVSIAADGTFRSEDLAPGPWTPVAEAPGCIRGLGESLVLGDGERRTGIEIVLEPASFVAGRVVGPSGEPAAGVAVAAARIYRIRPEDNTYAGMQEALMDQERVHPALTGADGRFRIEGIRTGRHRLQGTKEGFLPAMGEAESGSSETLLKLEEGLPLEGTIVEAGTGKPLPGLSVQATGNGDRGAAANEDGSTDLSTLDWVVENGGSSSTGPDGKFSIGVLPPGTYDLQVSGESGGTAIPDKRVRGVRAGSRPIVVEMPRGFSIAGRVEDGSGLGLDVKGVGVGAAPVGTGSGVSLGQRQIKPDGTFVLDGLAAGKYRLTVGAQPWGGEKALYVARSLEVEAGTTDLVLPLVRGKTISGKIVFADGTPPGKRGVHLEFQPSKGGEAPGGQEYFSVGDGGIFVSPPLPEGVPFDVEVRSEEGEAVASARGVLPGATGLVLRLESGGTIRGVVHDPEGKPLQGARVWCEAARGGGPAGEAMSVAGGTFAIEGLAPGTYRVYAHVEADSIAPVAPEGPVPVGTSDLVVKTIKGHQFRARCLTAEGQAFEGFAFVEWNTRDRWEGPFVYPVKEGVLLIRGLTPCKVRVRLVEAGTSAGEGGGDAAGPFEIPGEEPTIRQP